MALEHSSVSVTDLPLSNPYFAYPGAPIKGYHEFEEYNKELKRFYNFITDFMTHSKEKVNVHINIGAAMEEVPDHSHYEKYDHWMQLFPYHLQTFILGEGNMNIETHIIIVSPNESFSNERYEDPVFIKKTNEIFDWIKKENKKYISSKYPVTINIFQTMFPHNDQQRNKILMDFISKRRHELIEYVPWIDNLEQTSNDVSFIEEFYKQFGKFLDHINDNKGIVICFSFAVFNEVTDYKIHNNYAMISEIKRFFTVDNFNKRMLFEWKFRFDSTEMIPHPLGLGEFKITYTRKPELVDELSRKGLFIPVLTNTPDGLSIDF